MKTFALLFFLAPLMTFGGEVMKLQTWVRKTNPLIESQVDCFGIPVFKNRDSEGDAHIIIIVPQSSYGKIPAVKEAFRKFYEGEVRFNRANLQSLRERLADNNIKMLLARPEQRPPTVLDAAGWMQKPSLLDGLD